MEKIGKYQIIEELGKGAMGVVYKAFDPDINREVAIKTIRIHMISEDLEKEEIMKRFLREAQAAGKLQHPNIITIYDIGRENNMAYIVMQYIEGSSLQKMISSGEKYAVHRIIQLMSDLCDALSFAHQNGIVHRDIKPANILIDKNGKPYIVDFGVVHIEASTMTQEGTTIGTPSYMSPEQVMGKKIDNRSDVFSLGAILYELLTSKKPFGSESITTVIYRIIHEEPPSLTDVKQDVPPGFQHIINKALAKNPEGRYQTCNELSAELKALDRLSEKVITFDVTKEIASLEKKKPKLGLILSLVFSVIILGCGGAWYFFLKPKKAPIPERIQKTKAEEVKVEKPSIPIPPEVMIPDAVQKKLDKINEVMELGDYREAVKLAEQVLSQYENQKIAQKYLREARHKITERMINQSLVAGIESYKIGKYEKCIQEVKQVLELDNQNKEAEKYLYLADTAISRIEIKKIIERQRKAEEEKDIPAVLGDMSSPAISKQREEDAVLLFNYYDDIKAFVSDINITFERVNKAEVSFSYLLSAVYRKTDKRKIVFEGIKSWSMEKIGNVWKITSFK